jgi:hypothetical protein
MGCDCGGVVLSWSLSCNRQSCQIQATIPLISVVQIFRTNSINVSINDYKNNLGIGYEMDWHVQAWPNVNRFGDYHNLHNHPHSWLSGTYYVQVPKDTG